MRSRVNSAIEKGRPGLPKGMPSDFSFMSMRKPGERPSPPGLEGVFGALELHAVYERGYLPEAACGLRDEIPVPVPEIGMDSRQPLPGKVLECRGNLPFPIDHPRIDFFENETPSAGVLDDRAEQRPLRAPRQRHFRVLRLELQAPEAKEVRKRRMIHLSIPLFRPNRRNRRNRRDRPCIIGSSTSSTAPPSSPRRR